VHVTFFCATLIMSTTAGKTEIHSCASKVQVRRGNTQTLKVDLVFTVYIYFKQKRLNPVRMKICGSLLFKFTGYCSEPLALLWIECGGSSEKTRRNCVSLVVWLRRLSCQLNAGDSFWEPAETFGFFL